MPCVLSETGFCQEQRPRSGLPHDHDHDHGRGRGGHDLRGRSDQRGLPQLVKTSGRVEVGRVSKMSSMSNDAHPASNMPTALLKRH